MENSNTTPEITLNGKVKYVKYDADMFQAFVFAINDKEQINCKSTLPKGSIKNNDKVTLVGHWVNNPTYGKQFEVIAKKTNVPVDEEWDGKGIRPHGRMSGTVGRSSPNSKTGHEP